MGLEWLSSSGPSSLEEDFDPQVEWWLGHRLLGNERMTNHLWVPPLLEPQMISDVYLKLAAAADEVWAWTRLSPCWRSREASLSWICFLPARILRMGWHVKACESVSQAGAAGGPRTSVISYFISLFSLKGTPSCLGSAIVWISLCGKKTKPSAFHSSFHCGK